MDMDANDLLAKLRAGVATFQPDTNISPQNLLAALDQWEKEAKEKDQNDQAQQVADQGARLEAIERTALVDFHIKFLASSFDKGAAYTNIVLLAGYAAFFGLWSLVKDLGSAANVWSILCILASVTVFVVFEFVKMTFLGRQHIKRYKLYAKRAPSLTFEQLKLENAALETALEKQSNNFIIFWACVVPASAVLGFLGIALLAGDLLRAILAG
jgi:hypothetical protein